MAEQIMIYASSMITAQSVQLTVEQRAMLTAMGANPPGPRTS
jgi:hypothetical protein